MTESMHKQLKATFNGRVQGVGFRFTATRIARRFDVTGYVKNLADGTVEILAEGDEAVLKEFLQAVGNSDLKSYIQSVKTQWSAANHSFQNFEVAY